MTAAAVLGLVALLLVIEAAVFAITAFGVAPYWSCVIVAAVLGVAAGGFYVLGRADADEDLTPTRTIRQVKQDIATAKEQLT